MRWSGVILLTSLIRADWVFKAVQVRQAALGFVGILLALLALGWGYYTPFAAKMSGALLQVKAPLFGMFQRAPLFGRLSVVRATH